MIALIQRVSQASVTVDGEMIGEIEKGLLVFLAVEPLDNEQKANFIGSSSQSLQKIKLRG